MINCLYGFISGILVSFGMGGGSFLIYILSKTSEYSHQNIQYINLWTYMATGIVSILIYGQNNKIDADILKKIVPIMFFLCIISSIYSKNMDGSLLKKYFGIFLIVIGIVQIFWIIYKIIKENKKED